MQSPLPFSEVKKVLDAVNQPLSQPFGPGVFAEVLNRLQKMNPKRWAIENLTVFMIPKAQVDPRLSADAQELKEILSPNQVSKPRPEDFTPFSTSEKDSTIFTETQTFGTKNVVDDRFQLTPPIPQFLISNTLRLSSAPTKDTEARVSKRRPQSSQHSRIDPTHTTSNALSHSHSEATLGHSGPIYSRIVGWHRVVE